jgi:hypothetical protein
VREKSNLKSDNRWDRGDPESNFEIIESIMEISNKMPLNYSLLTDDCSFRWSRGNRATDTSALSFILEWCRIGRRSSRACGFPIERNGRGNGRGGCGRTIKTQ